MLLERSDEKGETGGECVKCSELIRKPEIE